MASPLSSRQALFVQPRLLTQSPELATLTLLEVVLEISGHALLAEHPTLNEWVEPRLEPVSLRRARRVLGSVQLLQRAVNRYRAAVLAVANIAAQQDDDDLPF
jgi:hypothetical protein